MSSNTVINGAKGEYTGMEISKGSKGGNLHKMGGIREKYLRGGQRIKHADVRRGRGYVSPQPPKLSKTSVHSSLGKPQHRGASSLSQSQTPALDKSISASRTGGEYQLVYDASSFMSNFAELEYLYKGELERKDVPWISSLRDTPNKSPIRTRNNAFDKEPSFYTNDIEKWRNKFKCILEKEQNQLKELHRTTLGQYWGPKNLKIAQSRSRYDRASLGGNEQTTFSTVDIKTHGQAQNLPHLFKYRGSVESGNQIGFVSELRNYFNHSEFKPETPFQYFPSNLKVNPHKIQAIQSKKTKEEEKKSPEPIIKSRSRRIMKFKEKLKGKNYNNFQHVVTKSENGHIPWIAGLRE